MVIKRIHSVLPRRDKAADVRIISLENLIININTQLIVHLDRNRYDYI